MKKLSFYLTAVSTIFCIFSFAQTTTSWKGITNTSWGTTTNWTNGLPSSTNAAIIGDASFTGSFQPTLSAASTFKSLTIGGTVASILTLNKAITVNEGVTINANGTLTHGAFALTIKGNWSNSGTYTLTSNNKCTVNFGGTTQTISGSNATTFYRSSIR